MLKEIGEDFYCSNGFICDVKQRPFKCLNYFVEVGMCPNCHRKHPTPEQYKEEYGEDVPAEFPVWWFDQKEGKWNIGVYDVVLKYAMAGLVVCACTPYGKPDKKQGEKNNE